MTNLYWGTMEGGNTWHVPNFIEPAVRRLLAILETTLSSFVEILVNHRPKSLRGHSLREALPVDERQPAQLRKLWQMWRTDAFRMRKARPALVFAVLGQAKIDGLLEARQESQMVGELLNHWALMRVLVFARTVRSRETVTGSVIDTEQRYL